MSRKSERGFAALDEEERRVIASQGGRAAHEKGTAHEFNSEEAALAGRKGGHTVSQNRAHMAAIGRKGGMASRQRRPADSQENAAQPEEQRDSRSDPSLG